MLSSVVSKKLSFSELQEEIERLKANDNVAQERVEYDSAVLMAAQRKFKSALLSLKSLQDSKDL
jgi:hypothetical protein